MSYHVSCAFSKNITEFALKIENKLFKKPFKKERENETLSFPTIRFPNQEGDHQQPTSPGSLSTYVMHPPVLVTMQTLFYARVRPEERLLCILKG